MTAQHGKDAATEANIKYFTEEFVNNYDQPEALDLGSQIAEQFLLFDKLALSQQKEDDRYPGWKEAKVLDFASGTGIISQNMAPHVKSISGVDISPEMVRLYNHKAQARAVTNIKATEFDLIGYTRENNQGAATDEVSNAIGNDYDAAVCSLSYHHISDTVQANKALFSRLKKGGWALVADFCEGTAEEGGTQKLASHGHSHSHAHDPDNHVPHKGGFSLDELSTSLASAGFVHTGTTVYTAQTWATEAFAARFKSHHQGQESDKDSKHGMKVWGEKVREGDGVKLVLIKWKMVLAYGQRPE